MRLISPNGTIDVPYEFAALQIDKFGAIYCNLYGNNFRLCLYSSCEKAAAVMKAIHRAYDNAYDVFQLPDEKELN